MYLHRVVLSELGRHDNAEAGAVQVGVRGPNLAGGPKRRGGRGGGQRRGRRLSAALPIEAVAL